MEHHPIPILILSSLTKEGSDKAIEALDAGAVDVLVKPSSSERIKEFGAVLVEKVKAAAQAKRFPRPPEKTKRRTLVIGEGFTRFHPKQLILIGASTGGVEALTQVLGNLPKEMPGICVVQHIPPEFTEGFATRLGRFTAAKVKVAQEGDQVTPGCIFIAPGGIHMIVEWQQDRYNIRLNQGAPIWHQRPSVDVLFQSAVESASQSTIVILLTGMGRDGAEGMKKLKEKGAVTVAQNEETCAIFGMPKTAIDLGAATNVLGLEQIPEFLVKAVQNNHIYAR